jgi:hypothetical protein
VSGIQLAVVAVVAIVDVVAVAGPPTHAVATVEGLAAADERRAPAPRNPWAR